MTSEKIADKVEELRRDLEWTNESYALSKREIDYGWDDDDTHGWLTMGPVYVEWLRDPYGDGMGGWIAVNVTVNGELLDMDDYSYLDDVVKGAAHLTMEWQYWRDREIKDGIVSWLEHRYEAYTLDGPRDVHDSWTIVWGDVSVQGYYTEDDGVFKWMVSNAEAGDYLDGDASDDADAVIDAMIECASDPWIGAWVETVAVETAEDAWVVRSSADQMTMWTRSSTTYDLSRRAYYEPVSYAEGRIELEHRIGTGEWTPYDELLPEDEEDVRRMAGEAYVWVRGIDD